MDLGLDEDIPADFEHHVLQQFDSLRSRSLLIYDEPVIEYISENDFLVGGIISSMAQIN